MSREQRNRLNGSVRNYKPERQKSPSEQFEALAYSITNGDCTDFDWARAESYLKAALAIREEEIAIAKCSIKSITLTKLRWMFEMLLIESSKCETSQLFYVIESNFLLMKNEI